MVGMAKGWYYIYRVKQFTYDRNKVGNQSMPALGLILALVIVCMIIILGLR